MLPGRRTASELGMAAPLPDKMIPEFKKDLDEIFFR
jgi:hypothetical protein